MAEVLNSKYNTIQKTIRRMEKEGVVKCRIIDGCKWVRLTPTEPPDLIVGPPGIEDEDVPLVSKPRLFFHDIHLHNPDFRASFRSRTSPDNSRTHTISKTFHRFNWFDLAEVMWKYNKNGSMEIRVVVPDNTLAIDQLIRLFGELEVMFNQDLLHENWAIKPGWGVRYANGVLAYRHSSWSKVAQPHPTCSFSFWFGWWLQFYDKEVPGRPELRELVLDIHSHQAMPFRQMLGLLKMSQDMQQQQVQDSSFRQEFQQFQKDFVAMQTELNRTIGMIPQAIQTSFEGLQLQITRLQEVVVGLQKPLSDEPNWS